MTKVSLSIRTETDTKEQFEQLRNDLNLTQLGTLKYLLSLHEMKFNKGLGALEKCLKMLLAQSDLSRDKRLVKHINTGTIRKFYAAYMGAGINATTTPRVLEAYKEEIDNYNNY